MARNWKPDVDEQIPLSLSVESTEADNPALEQAENEPDLASSDPVAEVDQAQVPETLAETENDQLPDPAETLAEAEQLVGTQAGI